MGFVTCFAMPGGEAFFCTSVLGRSHRHAIWGLSYRHSAALLKGVILPDACPILSENAACPLSLAAGRIDRKIFSE